MSATYNVPWISPIDEIRYLAQDNETQGDSTVVDPIQQDEEIQSALTMLGYQQGAITVFTAYATYYGNLVTQNTEGPETERWGSREKQMQDIANKITIGLILIGTTAAPQTQAGQMTTGQTAVDYYRQNGFWPRTTEVAFQ